jgi:hypothetical protein
VVFEDKLTQCDQLNTILENPFQNYDTLKKVIMGMLNQTIVKSMQKKAILLLNVLLKYLKMLINVCILMNLQNQSNEKSSNQSIRGQNHL